MCVHMCVCSSMLKMYKNVSLERMCTCSAEGDEGLRVLADKGQLVLGEGQPVHDVLDEVVGDDRRNVPPQLPQNHQLPVLWRASGSVPPQCRTVGQCGGSHYPPLCRRQDRVGVLTGGSNQRFWV